MTYEIHFLKKNHLLIFFGINPTLFFINAHELLFFETFVFHATYLVTFKDYSILSFSRSIPFLTQWQSSSSP
jgi:hypothetical protein